MKILYLDCSMGAAGDMLTAALLELFPEGDKELEALNQLNIPGVRFCREKAIKCGICGTHISVKIDGTEETAGEHSLEHHHKEEEHHKEGRHHSRMREIEEIVVSLPLSEKVRRDVLAVYTLIAEAESHVHGIPVADIHFHEVGTMDAIADVAAVCFLMDRLSPERIAASPIHVGSGQVRCAHGILPVPAPATAYILRDVPIYGGGITGELCTPTGAALLKYFVREFGSMPLMRTTAIGYGMGRKDFQAANCVRAMLGETDETGKDRPERTGRGGADEKGA